MVEILRYGLAAMIWVVCGGVLVVIFEGLFLRPIPMWTLILITALLVGGAVAATWHLIPSNTNQHTGRDT